MAWITERGVVVDGQLCGAVEQLGKGQKVRILDVSQGI